MSVLPVAINDHILVDVQIVVSYQRGIFTDPEGSRLDLKVHTCRDRRVLCQRKAIGSHDLVPLVHIHTV